METELQRLQRLLAEATQHAKQANKRAEQANQRVEQANLRADQERLGREHAERRTQPTTLNEYVCASHDSVFTKLVVETDVALTSKGNISVPQEKCCPTSLQPWLDFPQQQRTTLQTVFTRFPAGKRIFKSRDFIEGLSQTVTTNHLASEKDLKFFLRLTLRNPTEEIIIQLRNEQQVTEVFQLGTRVTFVEHPSVFSDSDKRIQYEQNRALSTQTPTETYDLGQLRPDQICIYREEENTLPTMVYVCEYKPPHKLTIAHLQHGLRPMDIHREVANRTIIPSNDDPEARITYLAEKYTASALTQIYHYMIEGGLQYGLLTTGQAFVFLKIDWAKDTSTLYYHLAEPGTDVQSNPEEAHLYTAVGQYLAFTLLALGTVGEQERPTQQERKRAKQIAKRWRMDFETFLYTTSPEDRRLMVEASSPWNPSLKEARDYRQLRNFERSPIKIRRSRFSRTQCNDTELRRDDDPEQSDDESSSARGSDTPSPSAKKGSRIAQRSCRDAESGDRSGPSNRGAQNRQYCTQKCLLGLVRGDDLDPRCANFELHRKHYADIKETRHPVTHATWLEKLREQLRGTLDDGIEKLPFSGARGMLFKVTLLAYGYTFVSKGTVQAFIRYLENEATVYRRLLPIQGVHVPVFLGTIDLQDIDQIYYYDHRVYVVHMTFLSWAGCALDDLDAIAGSKGEQSLRESAVRSIKAVHGLGIRHGDVRMPNMLFNAEINGVMVIDFEGATFVAAAAAPRAALTPLIPNKRIKDLRGGSKDYGKRLKRELNEEIMSVGRFAL